MPNIACKSEPREMRSMGESQEKEWWWTAFKSTAIIVLFSGVFLQRYISRGMQSSVKEKKTINMGGLKK